MSRPEQTLMRLVASWGAMIGLCLPAFAETSIPDRERMEVGNALSWQAVIPATANSPGRFGAHYKTRVVIFNPTSRDYTITARFYNDTGPARRSEIQIDAGEYLVWDNFLEEIFDYRGGGAVLLKADDQDDLFYMTAEVYTDSANGRFSTTVVSGIIPTFVSSSQPDFNVGINANRNRRTNIGVWNWETRPSSVEAKVFNGSGRLLQTIRFNLKAEAWQQKNISASVDNGLVRWEINGESKTHYFYAVEVDNKSNDGTLNWSVNGSTGGVGGNRAPELHRALRGLTLQVGGSAETVALGDHFSDPNGDRLTYVRSITPPGIISTTLVDADLRVTPVAAGTATVTVTARDPGGLEAQGTMEVRVNQDTTTGDPNPGDPRVFDGVEFVWVPPGQFQMGSISSAAQEDEQPLTQVRISRGFWMGKYEVTQAQWQSVMGSNPSRYTNCGGDCPVEEVSWEDVQEFIGKLNARSGGRPYRLPTEAEWEYAARAGTMTDTYAGDLTTQQGNDPVLNGIAWYDSNSGNTPHRVGEKAANAWGLHDMLGNVWEWVQDWYGSYPGGSVTDPTGPGSGSDRVERGGSWFNFAWSSRSANRFRSSPGNRFGDLGFRLLREGGTGGGGGNRAPELHRALRGLTLQVGGSAETVALGDHFSDPNGDRLTYVRSITPPGIISTTLVDADLRVTPVAAGTATVTVTARDPGGLEAQGTMEVRVNQDTTTGDPNPGDPRVFDGVEFVWVPPGQFQMGSTSSAADEDEQPLTQVRISRGFWMGKYEVTQAQWQAVMGSNPSHFTNCGGDCPVERVSWEDMQEFIGKLNARSGGRPYRLPTEAEWEYAARAGTMTDTYAGDLTTQRGNDPVLNGIAWYESNSGETTHRVGEKGANAWGLHDMLGNVWEAVQDWYGSASYPGGSVTDPTGPGSGSWRIHRGGSWYSHPRLCRSANRLADLPGRRFLNLGFRLLREGGTGGGGGNRAPELYRALPGLTLQVGGSADTVTLGDHFRDPNGDRLTYVRSITPAGIISTTLVDADLRVTPVAAGTATVTVTARDPGGLEAQGTMEVRVNQDTTTGDPNPGDPRVFDGVEFVWVPAGEFQMGSTSSESRSDERPVTQVRISRGFWMGKYEVTQAQWEAVMGSNPSRFKNCGGDCPVEAVSWEDVQEFIGKLNARSGGRPYRLPTEAEWEYAARAGTTEDRYGDLDEIAWYRSNSRSTTHLVGEKAANAWGLHDMLGNVWEWVQDWYGSYPGGSVTAPTGPGSGSYRVNRGGSWGNIASICRSADRNWYSPGSRGSILGFRLLREE